MEGKNNKILHIILAFLFCLTIISCGDDEEDTAKSSDNSTTSTSGSTETDNSSTADTTAPVIAEVTAVTTPTSDPSPNYTFSSSEAGTITYGGSCSSGIKSAISGNNTITLNTLSEGDIFRLYNYSYG